MADWDRELQENSLSREREEARERRARMREQEARAREEERMNRRAITRPLANRLPSLGRGRRRRCHSRVCRLPLVILRRRLDRRERTLLREGREDSEVREDEEEREGLENTDARLPRASVREAVMRMREGFQAHLAQQKCSLSVMEVLGVKMKTPAKNQDDCVPRLLDASLQEDPEDTKDIEGVLEVKRKAVFGKVCVRAVAEQYGLLWTYSREEGLLKKKSARSRQRSPQREEDRYAIFFPRQNKRKLFQVFGSTLHRTTSNRAMARKLLLMQKADKERKNEEFARLMAFYKPPPVVRIQVC